MTMAMKRKLEPDVEDGSRSQGRAKRIHCSHYDHISVLPGEVLLRILSTLPAETLTICQRLSQHFSKMANDLQLWKELYYLDFVRPRASRIPGIRKFQEPAGLLRYSSKYSIWLEDENLNKKPSTDWKAQYRLRYNWTRGVCAATEIEVAKQPPTQVLVQIKGDIVITATASDGLRAWATDTHEVLASSSLVSTDPMNANRVPTTLSIDQVNTSSSASVAIGFSDGLLEIFELQQSTTCHSSADSIASDMAFRHHADCSDYYFTRVYSHIAPDREPLIAVAYTAPYLVTMSSVHVLSLFRLPPRSTSELPEPVPLLLSSLKSHTAWPPLCLSVRLLNTGVVASVAYSVPSFLTGWSLGLQELRLSSAGDLVVSRLALPTQQGFVPLTVPSVSGSALGNEDSDSMTLFASKPTSLSYSHPYLLSSHSDNTITLHMVHSSEAALTIGRGQRLWGHTASVSDIQVGDRGRAVSVSATGGATRIWELEGIAKKRPVPYESGVEVRPKDNGGLSRPLLPSCDATLRGVVFNNERILLLREAERGKQNLVIYNFK